MNKKIKKLLELYNDADLEQILVSNLQKNKKEEDEKEDDESDDDEEIENDDDKKSGLNAEIKNFISQLFEEQNKKKSQSQSSEKKKKEEKEDNDQKEEKEKKFIPSAQDKPFEKVKFQAIG